MPPDNTPNDTRPSTPPRQTPNSPPSSHPYLQQLEEAISTPVPDFASTLTTPESRPQGSRPTTHFASTAWDVRLIDQNDSRDDSDHTPMATRESDLAASLDRMQSELDRWQTERNRLRTFLHNQQNRQSVLEQQNSRLREEHSRLVDEHSRLSSSITGAPSSRPSHGTPSTDQEQNTLSSLATAIAEVGRENYATRGSTPQTQRLYDWAAPTSAPASRTAQGEASNDNPADLVDTNSARHRELDRALRNYRMARNALRSDRPLSSDMGTVPTASALRAYWAEESHEEPQSLSSHRPPFALSQFVENHRRERQRRAAQESSRAAGRYGDATVQSSSLSNSTFLKERIRNTIHYLSKLRTTPAEATLQLARFLDLDTLYESEDANAPNDLPLLLDSLPVPQPSSWLVPGMVWHGLQSTDREQRSPAVLSSTLRRMRQREYIGRAMARRGIVDAQNATASSMLRDRTNDVPPAEPDTDRSISSLMRDTDGRWGFRAARDERNGRLLDLNGGDGAFRRSDVMNAAASEATATDHWPVTVTLHSVDYDAMEITGTMRASQIPDHRSSSRSSDEDREGGGRSMESFFRGEIVDLRRHALETEGKKRGYMDGGVDVDARYWARVGPFREAIRRGTVGTGGAGGVDGSGSWGGKARQGFGGSDEEEKLKMLGGDVEGGGEWDGLRMSGVGTAAAGGGGGSGSGGETREEREREADRVMASCVGSQRWLREKLGRDWILMRWKETCFVDPIIRSSSRSHTSASSSSSPPNTAATAAAATAPVSSSGNPIPVTDSQQQTWGLTISGFYYIALHRLSGRVEGLYYDPGSQPFQWLGMVPEGSSGMMRRGEEGGVEMGVGMGMGMGEKGGEAGGGTGVGVKRWFPAVEFR